MAVGSYLLPADLQIFFLLFDLSIMSVPPMWFDL